MFTPIDTKLSPKMQRQLYVEQRSKALRAMTERIDRNWNDIEAKTLRLRLVKEIVFENHKAPQNLFVECRRKYLMGLKAEAVLYMQSTLEISQANADFMLRYMIELGELL